MERDPEGKEFPPLQNDRVLRVLKGESEGGSKYTPVWVMRQAGRYLPEFQAVRADHEFFEVCRVPELACEVTLQPIRRFSLDAAIIFSDILVVPQAMGLEVQMLPAKGPHFPDPLQSPSDLDRLISSDNLDINATLGYVARAVSLTRHKLDGKVPLIGFSGAPWTLMCYMVEGGGTKTYERVKKWIYNHSEDSHKLLQMVTEVVVKYLIMQVEAGAQVLKIFDSWAGELGPSEFQQFSFKYLKIIEQQVRSNLKSKGIPQVPLIVFAKGAWFGLESLFNETTYDCIALDWTVDPNWARDLAQKAKRPICLQGNLDPCVLFCKDDEKLKQIIKKNLVDFGCGLKNETDYPITHLCNLGHGMLPSHDPDRLNVFVNAVHEISSEMWE